MINLASPLNLQPEPGPHPQAVPVGMACTFDSPRIYTLAIRRGESLRTCAASGRSAHAFTPERENMPPACFLFRSFDSPRYSTKKQDIPQTGDVLFFGGGEGSRTPVQKPFAISFSERSHLFKFSLLSLLVTGLRSGDLQLYR